MHCSATVRRCAVSAIVLIGVLALAAGCSEGKDESAPSAAPSRRRPSRPDSSASATSPPGCRKARRWRFESARAAASCATVGARTEFGSPQTLAVVSESGDWVAVRSPALGEQPGRLGAHPAGAAAARRPLTLEVDLSERKLTVRDPDGVVRRISVAIGAPETPTPPGDFYVTDKLNGADFGPYYGCCILALSGRQPNLPEGWSGGDRLAIHGSPTPTWGEAVSNGCLHADEADLRYLMRTVPLGTSRARPRVDSVDGTASPSCTRTSEAPSPPRSSGASRTSRASRFPVKDYWEFDSLVTVSDPQGVEDLNALDQIYHWTELIQSSPLAVERSVHAAIGGAYRSQGITTLELRFNPMKRNRGGERDLDHIIMAAVRGPRPREPRVPAGARRADPDDGPDLRRAAERDHRREGDSLCAARDRRHRHRRARGRARTGRIRTGRSRRSSRRLARRGSA